MVIFPYSYVTFTRPGRGSNTTRISQTCRNIATCQPDDWTLVPTWRVNVQLLPALRLPFQGPWWIIVLVIGWLTEKIGFRSRPIFRNHHFTCVFPPRNMTGMNHLAYQMACSALFSHSIHHEWNEWNAVVILCPWSPREEMLLGQYITLEMLKNPHCDQKTSGLGIGAFRDYFGTRPVTDIWDWKEQ